jgi:hypothetical protein
MIRMSILKKDSVDREGQDCSILGEFWLPFFFQGMVERFQNLLRENLPFQFMLQGCCLISLLLQADPCAWIFWAGCWCCDCQHQCCVLPQPICLVGTVRYGGFHKPVVMEKPLWVLHTVQHLQGMLCILDDIRSGLSLLEQRKPEIFLDGMQTWIVPWSCVLESCCHVVISWWSNVWLRWVKSILLLFGVV